MKKVVLIAVLCACLFFAACGDAAISSPEPVAPKAESDVFPMEDIVQEAYEHYADVYPDALNLEKDTRLLSAEQITGPFLYVGMKESTDTADYFIPDRKESDGVTAEALDDASQIRICDAEQACGDYASLLLTDEKYTAVSDGTQDIVYALCECVGYGPGSNYVGMTQGIYTLRFRVAFYRYATGELLAWVTFVPDNQSANTLNGSEWFIDQNSRKAFRGTETQFPNAWPYALGLASCDENGILVVNGVLDTFGAVDGTGGYAAELTEYTVAQGISAIGDYAFSNCEKITDVVLPSTLTSIGVGAFSSCGALTTIELPASVTKIGEFAFRDCPCLTEIVIPDGVTEILTQTFMHCTSLEKVVIPDSVTKLDWGAFSNCSSLTELEIPDSVTEIAANCFSDMAAGFTIVCQPDSYAAQFAAENGIPTR